MESRSFDAFMIVGCLLSNLLWRWECGLVDANAFFIFILLLLLPVGKTYF